MAKTVMIIDDSDSMRQVVSLTLKGAGYDVLEGCDGKDALAKLTGQKVHLIVCDVNMPHMDGFTFVSELKKIPAYRFTPVIMLTTEIAEDKKAKGQAVGAKAWMVKPFKPDQLLNAVAKLIAP